MGQEVREVGKRSQEACITVEKFPGQWCGLVGKQSGCGLGSVRMAREHLLVRADSRSQAAVDRIGCEWSL